MTDPIRLHKTLRRRLPRWKRSTRPLYFLAPHSPIVSPWGVGMLVVAVILVTEYAIMLVLPRLLYGEPPRLLDSTIDALMLSLVLSPVLWWTVVRPLRRASEQRISSSLTH